MNINDVDLDALPPDTPVIENGQVTPLGELFISRMTDNLIAACLRTEDPEAALKELPGLVTKCAAEIAAQRAPLKPSPVRAALTSLAGHQCLERRPDRDPLTGDRLDGKPDTDETWLERLLCVREQGHDGDHRDSLKATWLGTEASA